MDTNANSHSHEGRKVLDRLVPGLRLLRKAVAASAAIAGCLVSAAAGTVAAGTIAFALLGGSGAVAHTPAPDAVQANPGIERQARLMLKRDRADTEDAGRMAQEALEMATADPEACAVLLGVEAKDMDARAMRKAASLLLEEGDWLGPAHPRLLLLKRMREGVEEPVEAAVPGRR